MSEMVDGIFLYVFWFSWLVSGVLSDAGCCE